MKRLDGHQCYLIGPMDNVEDNGVSWRREITPFLQQLNIGILDPTNKACDYGYEDCHTKDKLKSLRKLGEYDEVCKIVKGIVRTDLRMVDRADFVIAYINTDIFMCGSFIEIAHATNQRKPIIIMCEQGKKNVPGFLWGLCGGHSTFFGAWQQVKDYLRCIDCLEKIDDLNGRWKFFDFDKVFKIDKENKDKQ